MMSRIHSLAAERQLTERLKAKSRRRRDDLARLAAPSAMARPRRNDLLPALDCVKEYEILAIPQPA